jgi:hypothetical protein
MGNPPKRKNAADSELHPDAWARFERAVDVVAKSPPQHRTKPKNKSKRSRNVSKNRAKGKQRPV